MFNVTMTTDLKDFFFTTDFREACSDKFANYCLHIACVKGSARFEIGDDLYNLIGGEIMIKSSAKPVVNLVCSDDLQIEAMIISIDYLTRNQPKSDYNIIGMLSTLENPIFSVDAQDIRQIQHDFREIRQRLEQLYNNFFEEVLQREVEIMIFDFYDMHSRRLNIQVEGKGRASNILGRFVSLLQKGLYKENRRVAYYASLLFLSPKYLSEACVDASGNNASYWIDRYTVEAVSNELLETNKTLQEIADDYNFSSVFYFSRYVKRHLGVSPAEYRNEHKAKKKSLG